jgi:hypothetical protein
MVLYVGSFQRWDLQYGTVPYVLYGGTEYSVLCRYLGLFAVVRVHGSLSVNHRPVR